MEQPIKIRTQIADKIYNKSGEMHWDWEMVESAMTEYALLVVQALISKVGYYEDGDIIYSGSSEFSAHVDEERLECFKKTIKDGTTE